MSLSFIENITTEKLKKFLPIILALTVAVVLTIIYVMSGKGSQDLNTRMLESNQAVQKVTTEEDEVGGKITTVECKNGSNYAVYYPPGSTDFEASSKVKCEQ